LGFSAAGGLHFVEFPADRFEVRRADRLIAAATFS
jgi:hypothetical protein